MSDDEKLVYKIEARGRALSSAEKINPVTTSYGQSALGQQNPPQTEKVLRDAQTIYDWLIKDL
jgi:hypothetical protein